MDGLHTLIHHVSYPNLILYGPNPSPQMVRHRIGVKGVSTQHQDSAMNIVYYHNYSEFNVKYIKVNQVEPWKRALEDCLKKTSYFTDSRRYIALTHFESCKPKPICFNKNNSHLTYSSNQLYSETIIL